MRSALALLLLALSASASAQERPDRTPTERLAVLGSVVVPTAGTATLLAFQDATSNDWTWCADRQGRETPACLELNDRWHGYAMGGRLMMKVDLASALALGTTQRLDAVEIGALTASSAATFGLVFHVAHNVAQGQPVSYFGTVAPGDRVARQIGPGWVFAGAVVATGAVLVLTYLALD